MIALAAVMTMGWSRALPAGVPDGWGVTAVGTTVVALSPGRLTAFAASDGHRLWTRGLPFPKGTVPRRDRSPVALRNGPQIVLVGSPSVAGEGETRTFLVSLDARTGATAWKREVPGQVWSLRREGGSLLGDVQRGRSGAKSWFQLTVMDAESGALRAELSPTDEPGNRAKLAKVCPAIADRVMAFGPCLVRNGIFLQVPSSYSINPTIEVIGDSAYAWTELEDFPLDLGPDSGKTGLRRFAIGEAGTIDLSADQWGGRGIGRHYQSTSSRYLGPALGEYRGGVLAALNTKIVANAGARFFATLVVLPKAGPFVATPVDSPSSYADFARGGTTDRGEPLLIARKESAGLKEIAVLMTPSGPKEQSRPAPEKGFLDWTIAGVCSSGTVFYARTELGPNAGPPFLWKQIVRVVPFERSAARAFRPRPSPLRPP